MRNITLNILGKNISFNFGTKAVGEIISHFDTNLQGVFVQVGDNPFIGIPNMMYIAHKNHCERQGIATEYSLSDFYNMIDDLEGAIDNKVVVDFYEAFAKSTGIDLQINYDDIPDEMLNTSSGEGEKKS